jgi:hypothetical protein
MCADVKFIFEHGDQSLIFSIDELQFASLRSKPNGVSIMFSFKQMGDRYIMMYGDDELRAKFGALREYIKENSEHKDV